MTKVQPNSAFEMEVCGRCGGTGNYSYNQIDGTRCFGCEGSGWRYTKRGKIARDFFVASLSIPAGQVTVGMRIDTCSMKFTVVEITAPAVTGYSVENGIRSDMVTISLTSAPLPNGRGTLGLTCSPEFMVKRIPTEAERIEAINAAVAYQETLTKGGTVRK